MLSNKTKSRECKQILPLNSIFCCQRMPIGGVCKNFFLSFAQKSRPGSELRPFQWTEYGLKIECCSPILRPYFPPPPFCQFCRPSHFPGGSTPCAVRTDRFCHCRRFFAGRPSQLQPFVGFGPLGVRRLSQCLFHFWLNKFKNPKIYNAIYQFVAPFSVFCGRFVRLFRQRIARGPREEGLFWLTFCRFVPILFCRITKSMRFFIQNPNFLRG